MSNTLILNGNDLTLSDVNDVVYNGRKVSIAPEALAPQESTSSGLIQAVTAAHSTPKGR